MASEFLEYPKHLKLSAWGKDELPTCKDGKDLQDKLKSLQKQHDDVDWKQFDDSWPTQSKSVEELDEAFALRDRLYRSLVLVPLKKDANEVARVALRVAKDKGTAKPAVETLKAIGTAAGGYTDAIDDGVETLKKAYDEAKSSFPEDDEDEDGSALVDPKKLLKMLTICKADPERRMQFGFVEGKDESPDSFVLHSKKDGDWLFKKLKKDTGGQTGTFGTAWMDGKILMLRIEKPFKGLVKKARPAIKECKFSVSKIVLVGPNGEVFEQDEELENKPPTDPRLEAEFMARLAELKKQFEQVNAADPARAKPLAELLMQAGSLWKNEQFADARLRLDQVKVLLNEMQPGGGVTKEQWEKKLAVVDKYYADGVRDNPDLASKLRAVMGFAQGKADLKDYAAAIKGLEKIEELLGKVKKTTDAPGGPGATSAKPEIQKPTDGQGRKQPSLDQLQKSRLIWMATLKNARAERDKLLTTILKNFSDDEDKSIVREAAKVIKSTLDHFNEKLADSIELVLNANEGDRNALHQEVTRIIDDYLDKLNNEPIVAMLDDNPFVPVKLHKTLSTTLRAFASSLN